MSWIWVELWVDSEFEYGLGIGSITQTRPETQHTWVSLYAYYGSEKSSSQKKSKKM